jgi:hypothetical protein
MHVHNFGGSCFLLHMGPIVHLARLSDTASCQFAPHMHASMHAHQFPSCFTPPTRAPPRVGVHSLQPLLSPLPDLNASKPPQLAVEAEAMLHATWQHVVPCRQRRQCRVSSGLGGGHSVGGARRKVLAWVAAPAPAPHMCVRPLLSTQPLQGGSLCKGDTNSKQTIILLCGWLHSTVAAPSVCIAHTPLSHTPDPGFFQWHQPLSQHSFGAALGQHLLQCSILSSFRQHPCLHRWTPPPKHSLGAAARGQHLS